MFEKNKKKYMSMNRSIISFTVFFFVSVILIFIVNEQFSLNTLRRQIMINYEQKLDHYISNISASMDSIRFYVANNSIDIDSARLISSDDELERFKASKTLSENMYGSITNYPLIDSVFIYLNGNLRFSQNASKDYADQLNASAYVKRYLDSYPSYKNPFTDGFIPFEENGQYYFLCFIKNMDAYVGVWINVDTLLDSIETEDVNNLVITDKNSNFMDSDFFSTYGNSSNLESNNKYIVVSEQDGKNNFGMAAVVERNTVFGSVHLVNILTVIFLAVLSGTFFIYLTYVRAKMLNPVGNLISTMDRIRTGHFEKFTITERDFKEFHDMTSTFNSMMDEIEKLKIEVYEEKLAKQKNKMQLLHLQIKPHFLINALNIVSSYARANEYDMVQKMIISISNHFRYILDQKDFVTLEREIEHTKNYLEIQSIRYSKNFNYNIDVEPELLDQQIPVLSIQTFVENSIKFLNCLNKEGKILLEGKTVVLGGRKYMRLTIDDNGIGFSQSVLEKLSKGEKIEDGQKEHIGIYNVYQRVSMLYGEDAEIKFSNNKFGGAHTELIIPLNRSKKEIEGGIGQ